MTFSIYLKKLTKIILTYSGLFFLEKQFYSLIAFPFNLTKYFIIWGSGSGIGDHVCMTAVVQSVVKATSKKVIVLTDYPELFLNNPYIYKVFSLKNKSYLFKRFLARLNNKNIRRFAAPSGTRTYMTLNGVNKKISLIEAHSANLKLNCNFSNLSPKLFFTPLELKELEIKYKKLLEKPYALISPHSKVTYTPNKEWGFDKFQQVINKTPNYNWVQMGTSSEQLLDSVIDYRGKTQTIRELAFLISKSEFVLSTEGVFNHLAAAFGVKSFVIFSGFTPIELAKYEITIPIVRVPQIDCAPCWLLEKCPKEKKWCTEDISAQDVIDVILKETD